MANRGDDAQGLVGLGKEQEDNSAGQRCASTAVAALAGRVLESVQSKHWSPKEIISAEPALC